MLLRVEFRGELPDNWTPVESIAVIKCLDQDGDPSLCIRSSSGLNPWEALGMLVAGESMAKDVLMGMFKEQDDD